MSAQLRSYLLLALFLVFIFVIAFFVWYSPILLKGYAAEPVGYGILLARNYSQTGVFGMEDDLNIFVHQKDYEAFYSN